jgi:HEAT repeat protein
MWRSNLFLVLLAILSAHAKAQEKTGPTVEHIRKLLNVFEFKQEYRKLIDLRETAFPAYEQILNDPTVNTFEVVRIFGVLGGVQADRRQFVEPAARRLADHDTDLRRSAIQLLGRIGSRSDAAPVVALLWDEDRTVVYAAAETLSAIGGERELVALDIWAQANAESLRIDSQLRQRTEQARDALRQRAEEERKKAGGLVAQGQPDRPVLSVREVRRLLTELPGNPTPVRELVGLGERAYPALEAFLNDPTVTDFEAMRLFAQLSLMPGDRTRFAPHIVRWLRSDRPRREGVSLLGAIGSRRDATPLVALLYDSNPVVVRLALEAVGKLGGEREMVAIDIWMKVKTEQLRAAEQARDALRKRVEEEKTKRGG